MKCFVCAQENGKVEKSLTTGKHETINVYVCDNSECNNHYCNLHGGIYKGRMLCNECLIRSYSYKESEVHESR